MANLGYLLNLKEHQQELKAMPKQKFQPGDAVTVNQCQDPWSDVVEYPIRDTLGTWLYMLVNSCKEIEEKYLEPFDLDAAIAQAKEDSQS